jgi:hypothetical protein
MLGCTEGDATECWVARKETQPNVGFHGRRRNRMSGSTEGDEGDIEVIEVTEVLAVTMDLAVLRGATQCSAQDSYILQPGEFLLSHPERGSSGLLRNAWLHVTVTV